MGGIGTDGGGSGVNATPEEEEEKEEEEAPVTGVEGDPDDEEPC